MCSKKKNFIKTFTNNEKQKQKLEKNEKPVFETLNKVENC